jgi:MoxR-like ATPase
MAVPGAAGNKNSNENKEKVMAPAAGEGLEKLEDMIVRAAESTAANVRAAKTAIGNVIFGQDKVVEQALITVLCGGHALLIGLPGLAKTKLIETMGTVLGLDARRIQFTPDLMPSDIVGSEVLEESPGGKRSFRFIPGPIFGQLLMADEINRASPRTQSALLQAMQERRVSIAGQYHALPEPFHVLATQNPLEQEGTYPLPEAQLDRFLIQIDVGYPDEAAERLMMVATTGLEESLPSETMSADELIDAQKIVRRIPVGERVVDGILQIVRAGRPDSTDLEEVARHVAWGPGPRASQALMLACRARALLQGRLSPSLDDVIALAPPVLRHRMALNFAARAEGVTMDRIIARLCERLS